MKIEERNKTHARKLLKDFVPGDVCMKDGHLCIVVEKSAHVTSNITLVRLRTGAPCIYPSHEGADPVNGKFVVED